MVTKEELLHQFVAKDVLKNKMKTTAGQIFTEYENELDKSNQIIKSYENFLGDSKIENVILDKICGDNLQINMFCEK